ncbi:MAG: hypothetical protein LBQ37_02645 [Elusimicrobiota bacterium]|jgi:hypothetical protein|nr:hypothetical protein [Elusimicrobiota bacterium]
MEQLIETELIKLYRLNGHAITQSVRETIELMTQELIVRKIEPSDLKKACQKLIDENVKRFTLGDILDAVREITATSKETIDPPEPIIDENGEISHNCRFCSDRGTIDAAYDFYLNNENNFAYYTSLIACKCEYGKKLAKRYGYIQWNGEICFLERITGTEFTALGTPCMEIPGAKEAMERKEQELLEAKNADSKCSA